MTESKETKSIAIDAALVDQIDRLAALEHRSRSNMIRELVGEAIVARRARDKAERKAKP